MLLVDLENTVYSYIDSLNIIPVIYPNSQVDVLDEDHARVYLSYIYNDKPNSCGISKVSYWMLKVNIYCRQNIGTNIIAGYIDAYKNGFLQTRKIAEGIIVNKPVAIHPFIVDGDGWYYNPVDIGLRVDE